MKVLFVHDHPFFVENDIVYSTGGLPSSVWKNYLVDDKIQLEVFARQSTKIRGNTVTSHNNVKFSFSKYYKGPKDYFLYSSRIEKELECSIRDSDKIVIRLPSFLGLLSVSICHKLKKEYYVEVVGNVYDSLYNYNFFGKIIAEYIHYKNKRAIYDASYSIYVTKEYLQKIYPCKNQTEYASDVQIEAPSKFILDNRVSKILQLSERIVCGTIGNLEVRYKGYETFFKVIAELKRENHSLNIIYQIAGAGNKEYLLAVAKKYGVEDDVVFCGKLDREEIFRFYDDIDIYIHPSFQEGLPRVVIESMNRACPVIASNVGGIPELINHNFLHTPGDYKTLKKIFLKLIADKKELIVQGRDNFNKSMEYSPDKLSQKRLNFYKRYLNF